MKKLFICASLLSLTVGPVHAMKFMNTDKAGHAFFYLTTKSAKCIVAVQEGNLEIVPLKTKIKALIETLPGTIDELIIMAEPTDTKHLYECVPSLPIWKGMSDSDIENLDNHLVEWDGNVCTIKRL
jgi:hypothetical protein